MEAQSTPSSGAGTGPVLTGSMRRRLDHADMADGQASYGRAVYGWAGSPGFRSQQGAVPCSRQERDVNASLPASPHAGPFAPPHRRAPAVRCLPPSRQLHGRV